MSSLESSGDHVPQRGGAGQESKLASQQKKFLRELISGGKPVSELSPSFASRQDISSNEIEAIKALDNINKAQIDRLTEKK